MTNAPASIHRQYLVSPSPLIQERAIEYASERGAQLWDKVCEVTSTGYWGFWTKDWKPQDRMAFLTRHPTFVTPNIDSA